MILQDGQFESNPALPDVKQHVSSDDELLLQHAGLFAGKLLPLLNGMKLYLAPDQDEERRENFVYDSYRIFYSQADNITAETYVYGNLKNEPHNDDDAGDEGVIALAGDGSAEDLPSEITFGRDAHLGYVAIHVDFYEGMYHGVLTKENAAYMPGPTRAATAGVDSLGQVQLGYRAEASSVARVLGFVRADTSALTPEQDTTIALKTFAPIFDTSEVLDQAIDDQTACELDEPA